MCTHHHTHETYREAVKKGNKVFGAAILKLSDLSLVAVGTNKEIECPLWHGEVRTAGRECTAYSWQYVLCSARSDSALSACTIWGLYSLLVVYN